MSIKKLVGGLAIAVTAALLTPVCVWKDDDKKETVVQALGYKLKVSRSPEKEEHTSVTLSIPGLLDKANREEIKAKIKDAMETADVDPEEMLLDLPEEAPIQAEEPEA